MPTSDTTRESRGRTRPARRTAEHGAASTQPPLPRFELPAALGAAHRCCGLDEVGRGALAGPLVAAAVVLPPDIRDRLGPLEPYLRDSKTVPAARRAEVAALVRAHAPVVALAVIPVERINARGIGWANREAFRQLIARVSAELAAGEPLVDEFIVDGRIRPVLRGTRGAPVRCLVRADALVPAVAAASLVAKVHRDALMRALHARHPLYAWDTNVGYGTAAHLTALRAHGPTPEHRDEFVRTALSHADPRAAAAPVLVEPA
jgi:ribonuclease HII